MAHHEFVPDHYYTTLGPHEPVLRVAPGDSVSTTTVDARGKDARNEPVAERGNPMTGPFYVEGAEPGDVLVVSFDRLCPNREQGWSRTRIAPNVLEPGCGSVLSDDDELAEWKVDLEAGTVELVRPECRLTGLKWPLAPMLGCFGVAPPRRQSIATSTSSVHGGNMDYRGFVEGVEVFLPVFEPGALFFLGDGHAIQGDGEIVGTGVEISFDVTFSVGLIKGERIEWPRAESGTHIMTVGNARPLDQAVQHATTEMVRWLQDGLGLDALSAQALLGQGVEYEVGNIFDPAYTMVCKLSKDLLAQAGVEK